MAKTAPTDDGAGDLVGAVELAARLGLITRAVRDIAERGIIRRHGRGKYRAAEATRAYTERLRESAAGRGAGSAAEGLDLVAERARLARAQAERQELELAVRRQVLVNAEQVKAGFVSMVTTAKTRLLGVPSKAKAHVPTLTVGDIEALEDLIAEALTGLADGAGP